MKTYKDSQKTKVTPKSILRQNHGQLILEYVLLVFVVAAAAVLLSEVLVSRDEGDPGIIVYQWKRLLEMVGQDLGD